ncbi:hypothetical protein M1105_05440 [Limibaculum sp. FT325]|uniref:hypothetical protein n=1 Tax=Thermohalobaculum sediminis TaxID=2939436 RepID=UPI0020BD99AC|nr:hypothetical protein [Limibaculum sediminis]MCL5776431.1 hypothetical protein [Limibaculum sediminis]
MQSIHPFAIGIVLGALAAGCSGDRADVGLGPACAGGLEAGYRELNQAEASGLSGSVKWSKAASLLGAAKVQEQFGEYQNCVIKVREARAFLREIN